MKQHLNTLFVTTEGAYLAKQGQAVAVRVEKKTRLRIPLHNLDGIVCFGRIGVSPSLMSICGEMGVTISMADSNGRFKAAIVGFSPGNVLLRRTQYRLADELEKSCEIARVMVAAKLANCRAVLLRAAREAPETPRQEALEAAAKRLVTNLEAARTCASLDRLRGIEGEGAATYFDAFALMIRTPGDAFRFTHRSRRPPLDPINALLSFLYAMLAHDARSACEAAGLDAAVGFLHRDRPGRPGLALDLMEELRPFLADRLALSLINRRQVSASGFTTSPSGAVLMDDATRKTVITAYQSRKQNSLMHPYLQEKTSVGIMIHLQARLLARRLRGDIDAYPAFIWR
ncbi:type I-C CRISPR-associated endonuclease Cas1c [Blastopirellula sp. J2-11]|uniref:type I-C CRISPR-associated endonuclease Cas1c n=1 Tax=Blastopirellula sp. J2-11 TaxID=2943192 RepID=UPI0021C76675|nr:type I-C CRISPR-associated endonuclease Cas1c [Blastopirellula sp. J2-11]UUO04510.1 type I-C CRISPR-associated endonuclease Cas1c [Blastopirellula sp. J2-11]